MTEKQIAETTTDWLWSVRHRIDREIERRKKEPVRRCWKVSINNGDSAITFKKYEDAKEEFLSEMDFSVLETGNQFCIEPVDIPESDHNNRPERWFD